MKHTVLITGTSSGIGYKTAQLAATRGHQVIATAPNAQELQKVPDTAALKLIIDICDQSSIDAALIIIEKELGPISCLINNAGFAQPGPIELVDDLRLRKQFDVNVFGTMAMTRAVLPQMRANGSGRIITLSSMLGLVSLPFQGVYAASKYALEALFDALRIETKDYGIDVVLIEPGWINTGFLKTATALTPQEWLQDSPSQDNPYAKPLTNYFNISAAAESDNPQGVSKIAASLAGSAEQVADRVLQALEADQPKVRYPVTAMAVWLPWLARLLPTRWWDSIQARQNESS